MLNEWRVAIVKPVGNACNLHCGYCFYNKQCQTKIAVMSGDLLERFTAQFMALFRGTKRFIWHGGEPLFAGVDFYRKAVELQQRYSSQGCEVANHIQTDGTLINGEWAQFFKKHGFKVGVSLDGDQTSHDRFRKDLSGRGSFERVTRGLAVLREQNVPFGAIMTVTKANLPHLDANFEFVRALGVGVAINEYAPSSSGDQLGDEGITPDQARAFWQRSPDPPARGHREQLRPGKPEQGTRCASACPETASQMNSSG